jgi:hypothetical protein
MKYVAVCIAVVSLGISGFLVLEQKKMESKIDTISTLLAELEYAPGNIEDISQRVDNGSARIKELEYLIDEGKANLNKVKRNGDLNLQRSISDLEVEISSLEERMDEIRPRQQVPLTPANQKILDDLIKQRHERERKENEEYEIDASQSQYLEKLRRLREE